MNTLSHSKRKIYITLAFMLTLILLFSPILGSLAPAQANAESFVMTNAVYGPNQDITIDYGLLSHVCDSLWAVSDIYIVPHDSVEEGVFLKDLDPSYYANTLQGTSGGGIAAEQIGFTTPSGTIGDGEWDVVEDTCQDGYFDANDTLLSPAFTVDITVDVPPLPYFEDMKSNAATLRDDYYDMAWNFAHLITLYKILDTVTAFVNPIDFVVFLISKGAEVLFGIDVDGAVIKSLFDMSSYYQGIAADPPDPEFRQITPLNQRLPGQFTLDDPLSNAMAQIGTEAADEAELLRVLLASLERYQGAEVEGNGDWALIHARAIQNYSDITAEQLLETNQALAALETALINDTNDFDSLSADLADLQDRLATAGFSDEELRLAANLGVNQESLADLQADFLAEDFTFSEADYLDLLGEIQTTNTALITDLNTLSADMAPIISTLENDPLVSDRRPIVEAGAGYNGVAGTAVTFDATGSSNLAATVDYAWDLDGDGEFDDAVGATVSFTYTQPFTGLVGLEVRNDFNFANIDYAPISIAPANGRPAITAFSPVDKTPTIVLASSQTFSVTAVDPEGDPLSIEWQVDGQSAGSGNSFVYTPGSTDLGLQWVQATVVESTPAPGVPVSLFWLASVVDIDNDGDGWNANVDCDDSDVTINPGQDEIIGNGIDDDCDATTSDVPPVPDFSFSPTTAFINEAVQFTDSSTDADGSVVAWAWNFDDGITSTLQHPSHTYQTPGNYTASLQVADNDGGLETTSQSITVYQHLGEVDFTTSDYLNKAQAEDGAFILDFSSESTTSGVQAPMAIDNSSSTTWASAPYEISDQYLVLDLVGDEAQYLSQVVLKGDNTTASARNFELFLSETGTDEADFTSVLTGEIPRTSELTAFDFAPTWAKYAKLVLYDNWGNTTYLRLSVFRLMERPHEGGIVSLANAGPAVEVVEYSSYYSQDPTKAFDTSLSTGWRPASGSVSEAWLKIDLSGQPVVIDRVALASKYAHVKDFEIRVSDTTSDDAAFTTVYSGTAVEDDTIQTYNFPPVAAKYVQLVVHDSYDSTYLYVTMLQVLAEDGVNLASLTPLNATVAAYSSYDYYVPNYAIDYSGSGTSSRWRSGSGQTSDQYLKVRLSEGGSYLINRVYLQGYGDEESPQDFEIRVSNSSIDDADFTTIYTGTLPDDEAGHYITFPPVEARYVELYIHNNHGHASYVQVSRFFVYSIDRGGPVVPFRDTSANSEAIISWLWDFGDGSTSTEQHPTHTYAAPGTYTVSLTIDSGIESTSTTMAYTVLGTAVPHFNQPSNPKEGYSIWFSENSTPAPDTAFLSFAWDFSVSTATGPGAYANFPDDGDYTVSLTALDTNFLYTTYTDVVSVANVAPNVNAGSDRTALALDPLTVHYNSSISDSGPVDAAALVCDWDFGDGTSTQIQNCDNTSIVASHIYSEAGIYTATVVVYDKDGGTDTDSFLATINKRETQIAVVSLRSVTTDTADIQVALIDNVIGNQPLVGFPVTISAEGQTVNAVTDQFGIARGTFNLTHGVAVSVTADFAGDNTFLPHNHTIFEAPAFDDELHDEYWLTFPSNWDNSGDPVIFVASETDGAGVVTIAELGFVQPFTLTGGMAAEIHVGSEAYLSRALGPDRGESFSYKAIHVQTTTDVQVYGLATNFGTSDAYTGLPVEDLGTDYMVLTYRNADIGVVWYDYAGGELAVVGVEPTTTVTITLPGEAPYAITLDEGQVYQVVDNMKGTGGNDYTGALVTADQPVAVFGGSNCTQIPAYYAYCDHLVEQMMPVGTWGWSFMTMPLATRIKGDTFRVLAQKDNTNVYINGLLVDTLGAGEFHETILTEASHITADQPVLVAQFSNGALFDSNNSNSGDPFMMLLPPYELATNYYPGISTPPNTIESNFLNVIVRNQDIGVVTLDGAVITPTLFVPISGTEFSGAQVPISVGQHSLQSELPFSVYVYGFDYYNSFGYPGGGFLISDIALTANIALNPATATRLVGENHCVTAVVTDAGDNPLAGVRVDLNRNGANPGEGFAFTDESGEARFCYDGVVQGTDSLVATTGIFSASASASWQVAAPDLSLTMTSVMTSAGPADTILYTLGFENVGTIDASGVLLNETVPAETFFDATDSSAGWSCADGSPAGTVCTLTLGSLGTAGTAEFAVTVDPALAADTVVTNTAILADDGLNGTDLNPADNLAAVTVNLIANLAPVALDDSQTTAEDTAVVLDVLTNDSDANGDPLTVLAITQPANGSASLNADNTITYTPDADYNSSDSAGLADSFSYTVEDGRGGTATATVSVLVTPINDDPTAIDDTGAINEDTAVIIDVLGNDSDVDGDSLTIIALTSPVLGTVLNNGDGTVTYTPTADLYGTDSFSYTLSDGNAGSAQAQVTVIIVPANDAPDAADDTAVLDEDSSITIYVLDNDSDVDGDAIQLVSLIAPANGSVVLNPDGSITYSPDADYNGLDSFSYSIDDGTGALGTAVVTVTVNPVNDAPVAADDLSSTLEDTPVTISVLDNDVDIDGDNLTVSLSTAPVNGSASVNVDGTISYTPTTSFNGTDTLMYVLSDGLETAVAMVTVSVTPDNDNPEAFDDPVNIAEDTAVTVDVLANDSDIDGDVISVSAVTNPANGSIVDNGDGTLTYTPDANYNGIDTVTYTIVDGQGGSASAAVIVSISPVNDDPVAGSESDTTNEDAAVTLAVLDNDSDVDGDSLTIVNVTNAAFGTIDINPDGTLTYTPDVNFNGIDEVTYTIEDGNGGSATAQVNIIVAPVNDDPVADDDLVTLAENSAVTVAVLDNDSDVDGDVLTVGSLTTPGNGTAVINTDGTITYTPVPGFNGADSFDYTVDDGNGGTDTATVIIIINPVSEVCDLYPIALHEDLLAGVQPGDILSDILNGEQAGNFGWLTWTGNTNTPTLINSLTLPGDSDSYVNPNDASDTVLSIGDWAQGKPGVSNAQGVRAALDMLSYVDIVVPIWDVAQGIGANTVYHLTGFATIRILDYDLPGQDQITAEFVGLANCEG